MYINDIHSTLILSANQLILLPLNLPEIKLKLNS